MMDGAILFVRFGRILICLGSVKKRTKSTITINPPFDRAGVILRGLTVMAYPFPQRREFKDGARMEFRAYLQKLTTQGKNITLTFSGIELI